MNAMPAPLPAPLPTESPAQEAESAFVVRGLTKVYRTDAGDVHALRGVNLDLAAGELVIMLGPSGSGKSTLLNILGGLDVPTAGQVMHRGRDLGALGERARTRYRREQVGFVFQFYNLVSSLTAVENVALATEIADRSMAAPMAPEDALDLVGLSKRRGHFPAEMSGGEQQRVAVARAIAKRPSILLCDEPTGALDSQTGIQVLAALQQAVAAIGATTVVITHNAAIGGIADRVVSFADGRIAGVRANPGRLPASGLDW